jgi:hypothetical protein
MMTGDAFGLRIAMAKLEAVVRKAEGKDLFEILRVDKILKLLIKKFSLSSSYLLPDRAHNTLSISLKNVIIQYSNFY